MLLYSVDTDVDEEMHILFFNLQFWIRSVCVLCCEMSCFLVLGSLLVCLKSYNKTASRIRIYLSSIGASKCVSIISLRN